LNALRGNGHDRAELNAGIITDNNQAGQQKQEGCGQGSGNEKARKTRAFST
jgi:hypothetical protein